MPAKLILVFADCHNANEMEKNIGLGVESYIQIQIGPIQIHQITNVRAIPYGISWI
jgi:hypothetical protein